VAAPLYEDRPALKLLNAEHDIAPQADRTALHEADDMPPDGLFIGLNWLSLEAEYEGPSWRWMDRNAQIVVTRPSGGTRALLIDLTPGPGFGGRPAELILRNAVGDPVATAAIKAGGAIVLDVPLPAATGAIYTLDTEGGGDSIAGDPRVLNFRVFGLRWAVPSDYKSRISHSEVRFACNRAGAEAGTWRFLFLRYPRIRCLFMAIFQRGQSG
jgi:hypothetical protein